MCKLIAELVGADKQVLREMITRLEHASGAPSVDVRLTGEIYGRLHMKMRELGLDPNDTTPHELYQALLSLTALHDRFLARKLGIENPQDASEVLPAVVDLVNRSGLPKQTWALKQTAARRLLKANPPKTLMKLLRYRSADSLLKRESPSIVMTAAMHVESLSWRGHFLKSYTRLHANDFETQNIQIIYLDNVRWKAVGHIYALQKRTPILHLSETGTIAVLPLPQQSFNGLTLASLLLVLHHVNDIRAHSTYFKFHHMRADFGKFLAQATNDQNSHHALLAGQPIHWRIIHRYYGSQPNINHPEIFEPHVQPEDMAYRKAEATLYKIEPALHFWHNNDYIGLPQPDGPISFNLTDMAMNVLNHIPYSQRANYHMRDALWNELYGRYIGERNLERELLQHLDEKIIPEPSIVPDLEFAW
ncbi:MAG TPA: hypothetical protein VM124_01385 [Candidatus Limnocylindrales bacterium]|nr:hypothetical protein [Candidatus Limnocylindrales bacterium]